MTTLQWVAVGAGLLLWGGVILFVLAACQMAASLDSPKELK